MYEADMDEFFSTFQAIKVLGIQYGRLREWVGRGYINPTVKADGQGTRSLFSRYDLYVLKLFYAIARAGVFP
jgi:hypothetical protein